VSAPIALDDEVVVRDPRQCGPLNQQGFAPIDPRWTEWTWFVVDVCGVAATIARSPLATITAVTPVSNLRRAEVTV
jgi:hypothetical protein